uniref:Solute carrier family 66 member 3 n=1 Tax=Ursus maritimus TaxID=29073 RepID=A0A452T8E8_URSMA
LAARSARGISLPSLLLELAGFLVFLRYQCYYEYPLLTYLEYPILIAQGKGPLGSLRPLCPLDPSPLLPHSGLCLSDVLLLLCVFHFNGNVKGAAPYLAARSMVELKKIPNARLHNLSTFISTASKFAQLQYLWKTRDSGAVSALTWSLASYTCATRIITTLMTTSDLTILVRFVLMLALNLWVTATVLRYRKTVVKAE